MAVPQNVYYNAGSLCPGWVKQFEGHEKETSNAQRGQRCLELRGWWPELNIVSELTLENGVDRLGLYFIFVV